MKIPLAMLAFALFGGGAAAQTASPAMPIPVHMKRGTDRLILRGELVQNVECCTYRFEALAGQSLIWNIKGAATRVTLQYPDGHADGPFTPGKLLLPSGGAYLFTVSPNLMADGAFGKFVLTLRIPPRRAGARAR